MNNDHGQQRYRAQQRRRRQVLIALGLVMTALGATRLLPLQAERAAADNSGQVSSKPVAAEGHHIFATQEPIWPSGLQRDLFHLKVEHDPEAVHPVDNPQAASMPETSQLVDQAMRDLRVQGFMTGRETQVMVNGRCCRVGDSVSGYTIRSIDPQMLTVERDGHTIMLSY